jgi:hypothetical protein
LEEEKSMSKKVPQRVADRLRAAGWTEGDIAETWGTGDVKDVTDEQVAESIDSVAASIPLDNERHLWEFQIKVRYLKLMTKDEADMVWDMIHDAIREPILEVGKKLGGGDNIIDTTMGISGGVIEDYLSKMKGFRK